MEQMERCCEGECRRARKKRERDKIYKRICTSATRALPKGANREKLQWRGNKRFPVSVGARRDYWRRRRLSGSRQRRRGSSSARVITCQEDLHRFSVSPRSPRNRVLYFGLVVNASLFAPVRVLPLRDGWTKIKLLKAATGTAHGITVRAKDARVRESLNPENKRADDMCQPAFSSDISQPPTMKFATWPIPRAHQCCDMTLDGMPRSLYEKISWLSSRQRQPCQRDRSCFSRKNVTAARIERNKKN